MYIKNGDNANITKIEFETVYCNIKYDFYSILN